MVIGKQHSDRRSLWKLKARKQFGLCIPDLFASRMDNRRISCSSRRESLKPEGQALIGDCPFLFSTSVQIVGEEFFKQFKTESTVRQF